MPLFMAVRSLEPDWAQAAVRNDVVTADERLLVQMLDPASAATLPGAGNRRLHRDC